MEGNARELRSYLEEAVALSEARILDVAETLLAANAAAAPEGEFVPLHAMIEEAERRHVRSALERRDVARMPTGVALTWRRSRSTISRVERRQPIGKEIGP